MKLKRNFLIGAGAFLISFLMILSSSATIANNVEKNKTTAAVDTADMEYPVNFNYENEVYEIGGFQRVKCYASNLQGSRIHYG